jgi:hypothetical protein
MWMPRLGGRGSAIGAGAGIPGCMELLTQGALRDRARQVAEVGDAAGAVDMYALNTLELSQMVFQIRKFRRVIAVLERHLQHSGGRRAGKTVLVLRWMVSHRRLLVVQV